MKKNIIFLIFIMLFCNSVLVAQNEEEIALQSLEYLNKKFYLNLEKSNYLILVKTNSYNYLCVSYFNNIDELLPLSRIKVEYRLHNVGDNKYHFYLKISSEYQGNFEVVEDDGKYFFHNLDYVKATDR